MQIWDFIIDKNKRGLRTLLLYVVHSEGSSPGRQGFGMAISEDTGFTGTIGGGIMEHKFVELAKNALQIPATRPKLYRQVHNKSAEEQSGMICSGEQTIFFYEIMPPDIMSVIKLTTSANMAGTLELSINGIAFHDEEPSEFYFKKNAENDFIYREGIGKLNQLHIIGGGHCSLALSRIMSTVDFNITVYDEREGLDTMEHNDFAGRKVIVNSYHNVGGLLPEGENIYVVVMTFGYRTDDTALKSMMHKNFKYLGLLGSKAKVDKMFTTYRNEEVKDEILNKIHAPIGIPIKSETTTEIAISIAAEIIGIKNMN